MTFCASILMPFFHSRNKSFQLSYLLILGLLLFGTPSWIFAESVRAFASPIKLKLLKENLEKTLNKIDEGNFNEEEETYGFTHLYENGWLSAYDYEIYIGTSFPAKKQTIVRIEGDDGDVTTIARILDIEGIINKDDSLRGDGQLYKPETKYHIFAQPLNLISPSLSVLYQSYTSPRLTGRQTIVRALNYLLLDVIAYWVGGNAFFTSRHSPQKNREVMLLCFAFNRAVGSVQGFNIIRGHNSLLKFGYTFPIE